MSLWVRRRLGIRRWLNWIDEWSIVFGVILDGSRDCRFRHRQRRERQRWSSSFSTRARRRTTNGLRLPVHDIGCSITFAWLSLALSHCVCPHVKVRFDQMSLHDLVVVPISQQVGWPGGALGRFRHHRRRNRRRQHHLPLARTGPLPFIFTHS